MGNIKPEINAAKPHFTKRGNPIDFGKWLKREDDRTGEFKPGKDGKPERRPRYFCGLMRYRWNESKKLFEVCVITYRENGTGPKQIKFPGGCSNFGETPRQCLHSESVEETGRAASKGAQVRYTKVHRYKEGPNMGKEEHIMFFFSDVVEYQEHTPFLKTKSESDGGECSPVRWEPLTQALVDQFHRTHRPALEALHEEIMLIEAVKSLDKYDAVANLKF